MKLYLGDWKYQLNPEDPYLACTLGIRYPWNWVSWVMARGMPRGRMSANLRISWRTASVCGVWALSPWQGHLSGPTPWSISCCMSSAPFRKGWEKGSPDNGRACHLGHPPYPQLPRLQAQDCINGSHLAFSKTDTRTSLGVQRLRIYLPVQGAWVQSS